MTDRTTDGEDTSNPSLVLSYWYNLDRGWQALYLGLLITIIVLIIQFTNLY
jgi:hypothetical protein